jgi:chemotaxis methyl-accepting protein methylase
MRISQIQPQIAFKSNILKKPEKAIPKYLNGQVILNGEVFNRHSSFFFRDDIDWIKFGTYLKDKYKATPKVNTLIWGCSQGQEAYTMAILLKHYFGKDNKKFLPIKAMDISEKLINQNIDSQKEGFRINDGDVLKIREALGLLPYTEDLYKYCVPALFMGYQFKKDIIDSVEFSRSNILTDLDKIDSKNPSIVMCRNMWPYIDSSKYDECAKKLYDKLAKGSIVVIGRYDWDGEKAIPHSKDFPKALINNNFKPVNKMNSNTVNIWKMPNDAALFFEK